MQTAWLTNNYNYKARKIQYIIIATINAWMVHPIIFEDFHTQHGRLPSWHMNQQCSVPSDAETGILDRVLLVWKCGQYGCQYWHQKKKAAKDSQYCVNCHAGQKTLNNNDS